MAASLQSNLVDGVHRFIPIKPDVPVPNKTARLPDECFYPKSTNRSLPFQDIVTTAQTLPSVSPQGTNLNVNVADYALIRDAKKTYGKVENLGNAWQGCLLDASHSIRIGERNLGSIDIT